MSETVQNISAGGYSLVIQDGRNMLLSGDGNSYELTSAEVSFIMNVRAEDFHDISSAYSRALSEFKTRGEILSLAVSSHTFIRHNEAVVREVNAVLQDFASSFYAFIGANPQKAERYQEALEDMIYAAARGEPLKKGNVFGPRNAWQKLIRRFRKNPAEENLWKQAKALWCNVSLNQELYGEYICGGGVSFDGIVAASAENCRYKLECLKNQEESLETARKQKEAVQKRVGMLAVQNYLAGKLYVEKEKMSENSVPENGNVIDFPKAVHEIKRAVRIEDLVFINA